ncbi:MAG TPA: hypothetical protein VF163_18620 [Micromonosporaceae bacterium]
MDSRAPSGLFPSRSSRPVFREPHPVRLIAILAGSAGAAGWLMLWGLLATSVRGYLWLTLIAASAANLAALVLARFGDRGVAVGVAVVTGVGVGAAFVVLIEAWMTTGWPMW